MFDCKICGAREWDGETAHDVDDHIIHYKRELVDWIKKQASIQDIIKKLDVFTNEYIDSK